MFVSRVGLNLYLMNRIRICRVLRDGLYSSFTKRRTPSTPQRCIRSLYLQWYYSSRPRMQDNAQVVHCQSNWFFHQINKNTILVFSRLLTFCTQTVVKFMLYISSWAVLNFLGFFFKVFKFSVQNWILELNCSFTP